MLRAIGFSYGQSSAYRISSPFSGRLVYSSRMIKTEKQQFAPQIYQHSIAFTNENGESDFYVNCTKFLAALPEQSANSYRHRLACLF